LLGGGATTIDFSAEQIPSLGASIGVLVVAVAGLIVTLWIYVSWHRYILLEEYPEGWIPKFRADRIMSYFGKGFAIFLILFVCVMALSLVAALAGPASFIIVIPGFLALGVFTYRWFPVLPAAAIGKPLTIREAWGATEGATGAIIVMVILMILMQLLLSVVVGVIVAIIPLIGIAAQTIFTLILSLINVSIMTTMYGHYVEGRPID
jgi:hypothetical protein